MAKRSISIIKIGIFIDNKISFVNVVLNVEHVVCIHSNSVSIKKFNCFLLKLSVNDKFISFLIKIP